MSPRISREKQAADILRALSTWCSAAPGRSLTVHHGPDGWRAELGQTASAGGVSLTDALAQVAMVANFEGAKP